MATEAQVFYGTSTSHNATRAAVLAGHALKINLALVTPTEDLVREGEPQVLQERIWEQVTALLAAPMPTYHVGLNFDDYRRSAWERPPDSQAVPTQPFPGGLNA